MYLGSRLCFQYELKYTGRKCEAALHRGFSASVRSILWERRPSPASRWVSAELSAPPGEPGFWRPRATLGSADGGIGARSHSSSPRPRPGLLRVFHVRQAHLPVFLP